MNNLKRHKKRIPTKQALDARDVRNLKYRKKKGFLGQAEKSAFFGKSSFYFDILVASRVFRLQHTLDAIKNASICGYILEIALGPLSRRNVKRHFYVHV